MPGTAEGGAGPRAALMSKESPANQFNRRTFAWNSRLAQNQQEGDHVTADASKRPPSLPEGESMNRVYEVICPTGAVRAEPHLEAKMKCKKSRGSRFYCSGVTMNGWLKLDKEPGWFPTDLRGVNNIWDAAQHVNGNVDGKETGPLNLAVDVYQPQGISCFEVVFKDVPLRDTPSRTGKALATRKKGEYVFAALQNFDGWVKLEGEDTESWMLAASPDHGELLKRRRGVSRVDLWALSDAWAAVRKHRGTALSSKEVTDLKDLEKKVFIGASRMYDQDVSSGSASKLVEEGLLATDDLQRDEHWIRQRLFANLLAKHLREKAWDFPEFALSPRVPPLPPSEWDQEDDEPEEWAERAAHYTWGTGSKRDRGGTYDKYAGGPFEGTTPFEFNGKTYVMTDNMVLFDPPNETPIGIWNPDTRKIDPAAGQIPGCPYTAVSYFGKTYLVTPELKLLDQKTQAVVGRFNMETCELELDDAEEVPDYDPVFDDDDGEPMDIQEYFERGLQMAKKGRFKAAATLYGEALRGCRDMRSVDLDFECELLRARAACWCSLERYEELLQDAERILAHDPLDQAAMEWRTFARQGLWTSENIGPRGKCIQCNDVASKCAACGRGMERCGNCSKPVSRANCCSRCHRMYYCDRDCQRKHWKVHKTTCRSAEE